MKKVAIIAAASALALCLAGCAQESEPAQESTSETATAEAPAQEAESKEEIAITDSGWWQADNSVYFAATIENMSSEESATNIPMTVTCKDADGKVVDAYTAYHTLLFPEGVSAICGEVYGATGVETVDFAIGNVSIWEPIEMKQAEFDAAFRVENLGETPNSNGGVDVTGEVVSEMTGDFTMPSVEVVFRDAEGAIVGGCVIVVSGGVPAGSTVGFSGGTFIDAVPEHATVEAYIDCGLPDMSE